MAYVSQEKKSKIAAALKACVPAGWKYSLAVRHHSTIVMTVYQAPVDLIAIANQRNAELANHRGDAPYTIKGYFELNHYGFDVAQWGAAGDVLGAMIDALNTDNHNRNDLMTDYYDVGHYITVNIGKYDKHFAVTTTKAEAVAA